MGVNAGVCSGSTDDFGDANKNELSDQHVRYLAARGEIGEKEENKFDITLQGELSGSE